jgi:RNA polymerase sigma-70 factor, ECF subfamily
MKGQLNSDRLNSKALDDFSKLYSDYYVLLCTVADQYLKDKYLAEEIVGDIFLNFWEKYNDITIISSVKAYLIRAVQNRCVNYLEHLKVEQKLKQKIEAESTWLGLTESDNYPLGCLYEKELDSLIRKAMTSLPEQCRKIFLLSRDEELTYEEISQALNISVNTVKTQIKIALVKLREWLKDYLPIVILAFTALMFHHGKTLAEICHSFF